MHRASKILNKLHPYSDILFFTLAVIFNFILVYPYHNFQIGLAQGDHGNNLYCARKALQGSLPYKDYWWVYGPSMLYYYAFFYNLLGINIHSALIGYRLLCILSGIIVYLIIRLFFSPYMALTASIFFSVFTPKFFHTYNHQGGVLMILTTVYFYFLYLKNNRVHCLYFSLLSIFILSLIKLNIGISTLTGFLLLCVWRNKPADQNNKKIKKLLWFAVTLIPICIGGVYWFFLRGAPSYIIYQSLTFLGWDPFHSSLTNSLTLLYTYLKDMIVNGRLLPFNILFFTLMGILVFLIYTKKLTAESIKQLKISLLPLIVIGLLNLHEFIPSGVMYRVYWSEPLRTIGTFMLIFTVLVHLRPSLRIIVCLFILALAAGSSLAQYQSYQLVKKYIPLERGKIYVANPDPWVSTVLQATTFLKNNLHENETFFALPSDQIYYFLTDKDSPVRQTDITTYIEPKQEKEIMESLDKKNVKYILLSNHYRDPEMRMGALGQAYCRDLFHYIQTHYKPCMILGEWDKRAESYTHHGVLILKRIEN